MNPHMPKQDPAKTVQQMDDLCLPYDAITEALKAMEDIARETGGARESSTAS